MRHFLSTLLRGAAPRRPDGFTYGRLENASDATLRDIGLFRDDIGRLRLDQR